MEYLILELDEAYIAPRPLKWLDKLDVRFLQDKKHYEIPQRMIFQIEKHMQMVWTDIIMHPCFMVSQEARNTIRMYDPSVRFLRVIFSDKETRQSKAYYMPFLTEINALTPNSELNTNKSIIYHAEVDGSKMKNRAIAKIGNITKHNGVLIRSDLAESLLSGDLIGIGLKETNTVMPKSMERSKL